MKMTKVQHRAVKDLAIRMCANYDRPTGDCLLMDESVLAGVLFVWSVSVFQRSRIAVRSSSLCGFGKARFS